MSSAPLEQLRHILEEIDFLERETTALTKEAFLEDPVRLRAFARSLEIIGQAVKGIPREVRDRYPDIPWSRIAGMRDHLIHGYFSVDYDIVWDAATNRVTRLRPHILQIIERERRLWEAES